jgi:transcriptional regulator with XRE-family HTH domain
MLTKVIHQSEGKRKMKISDRLILMRKDLSLSGSELGALAGVSKSAISKLELGKSSNLKLAHLYSMADETGYSAEWIAIGRGKKVATPPEFIIDLMDYSKENRQLILQLISHIPKR